MKRVLLAALAGFGLTVSSSARANMSLQFDEADVMERNEWVMFVRARKLSGYLSYPGSQLSPLTEVKVSFWNSQSRSPANTYEEFWYHSGAPVGMRRYNQLKLRPHAIGTIFVQSSPDAAIESRALVNAVLRLTVDLSAVDVAPGAVIVPQEIYPQAVSDLTFFGFSQRTIGQFDGTPRACVHLVSNPTTNDSFFYFNN
ncbi:MAG TPA: hypothetical protein V6C72_08140 [Chroococcales cyanobacterium]